MVAYSLQQAQSEVATIRGQIAHLLVKLEVATLIVDTLMTGPDASTWNSTGLTLGGNLTIGSTKTVTGPDGTVWDSSGIELASGKQIHVDTWQGMTGSYTNSWSDQGSGNGVGRYRHLSEKNMVRIEGSISHGSITGSSAFFTLPAGYRPSAGWAVCLGRDSNGHSVGISVATTGVLTVFDLSATVWVQFAGEFSID